MFAVAGRYRSGFGQLGECRVELIISTGASSLNASFRVFGNEVLFPQLEYHVDQQGEDDEAEEGTVNCDHGVVFAIGDLPGCCVGVWLLLLIEVRICNREEGLLELIFQSLYERLQIVADACWIEDSCPARLLTQILQRRTCPCFRKPPSSQPPPQKI